MKKFLSMLVLIISSLILGTTVLFSSACNTNYPESRSFIVTNRKSFEKIVTDDFSEFEVDFDKEMILVYTFGAVYVLPARITEIELNNETLTVNYNIDLVHGTYSACQPFQRWFIVKLNKLDITSVKNSVSEDYIEESENENLNEGVSDFNAKLFDNCGSCIKGKFKVKNRVKGAIYD